MQAKIKDFGKCPLCKTRSWELIDGFVVSELVDELWRQPDPYNGRRLASVGVMCSNCGNTVLLNALKLGLDDLAENPVFRQLASNPFQGRFGNPFDG